MKYTKTTRIWEINTSKLIVADTLDEAIELWKSFYNIEEDPTCTSAGGGRCYNQYQKETVIRRKSKRI